MKYLFITTLIIMALAYSKMMAQEKQKVSRKDLMTALLTKQEVSNIEIKEVTMPVKCIADLHLHPCPVVGYIVSGTALYQEEGKDPIILNKGDTFYEPKNKTILHFDNFSETESLIFIAIYLKEADEDLISIL